MEAGARIDPGSLRKLVQASRTWDRVSRAEMRKGLRAAAAAGAEAAKAEVLGPPPVQRLRSRRAGKRTVGLRAGLARGVKVSIQTGRVTKDGAVKGEGVRVTTTSTALPESRAPMVKAYMATRGFRHPVFGDTERWVGQKGKNWFYRPLYKNRPEYQAAIVKAIEAASQALEN